MPAAHPEERLPASAWELLAGAICRTLPPEIGRCLRITFCDRDEDGAFVRFAGLRQARTALLKAYEQSGVCPPILVLGLFPPPAVDGSMPDRELAALLQWPGVAYLPYGFTRERLVAAAHAAVEGARMPPPPGILPSAADILRLTSEIRHWLENRLRNTKGALSDLEAACRREKPLHASYLEAVAAMSDAHRAMLDRLCALEALAAHLAPATGGLGPTRTAIETFETRWQALEVVRVALRETADEQGTTYLAELRESLLGVCEALSTAIAATRNLDSELMSERDR